MEAQFSPLAQQQQGVMAGRLIANRVFVGNLPNSLAERDLMALFSPYGKIRDVKIIPENSRNKSYGFVTFFSEGDARRLIQVVGCLLVLETCFLCVILLVYSRQPCIRRVLCGGNES